MNRARLLQATNSILFAAAVVQGVSGISLFFHGPEILEEIHEYNGFVLLALIVGHLALNWGWVRSNFFKTSKRKS